MFALDLEDRLRDGTQPGRRKSLGEAFPAKAVEHSCRRIANGGQVIATLKDRCEPPLGRLVCASQEHTGHERDTRLGSNQTTQRVSPVAVKAGRYQHELRSELP